MIDEYAKELEKVLFKYQTHELERSNPYVTKSTVSWRVLFKCAQILQVDVHQYDRKKIFIHDDIMNIIDHKWTVFLHDENIKLTHDDTIAYERIKASDFIDLQDIYKFISVLNTKTKNDEDDFIVKLLAIDGFHGVTFPNDLKNYANHLKNDSQHVLTVRKMYDVVRDEKSAENLVFLALLNIYEKFVSDDEIREVISNFKDTLKGDAGKIDTLVTLYERHMDNLENIASVKLSQLSNRAKKSKNKRGRKSVVEQKEIKRTVKVYNSEDDEPSVKKRRTDSDDDESSVKKQRTDSDDDDEDSDS